MYIMRCAFGRAPVSLYVGLLYFAPYTLQKPLARHQVSFWYYNNNHIWGYLLKADYKI